MPMIPHAQKFLTPVKAIRAKCLDCSGNQPSEVRHCTITSCALWPYRMGHRPKRHENATPKNTQTD